MRKGLVVLAVSVLLLAMLCGSAFAGWSTFVIRKASDGSSPQINSVVSGGIPATEFVINKASMKAALGSSDLNGTRVGDLRYASISRLDNYARFSAGSGPAVAPYFNMWITDGHGKYAVIANEPSNAEWSTAGQKWNFTWDILKTKTLKVYETNDKSWLPNNGVGLKFQDIANFVIQSPTSAELTTGWSGLSGGAPRELGTNNAWGFNWMFGDTLSNYVSGDPGYIVANPNIAPVPEPASLTALGLGLSGVLVRRRKRA